jgi:hypothetical protein
MATRSFCDLCGVETTDTDSGVINGIETGYVDGCGTTTDHFDVCAECYAEVTDGLSKRAVDAVPKFKAD